MTKEFTYPTSPYGSRKDAIRDALARTSLELGLGHTYLRKTCRGQFVCWTLWIGPDNIKYILLFELTRDPQWGYRVFSESSPFPSDMVTCPLKYLDESAVIDAEWRSKVRDYYTEGKIPAELFLAFRKCPKDSVISVNFEDDWKIAWAEVVERPAKGELEGIGPDGRRYRINARAIKDWETRKTRFR